MTQIDVQAEGVDSQREAFERGWDACRRFFGRTERIEEFEALRELPAGSLIKDERGRVLFRTRANGWVTVTGTHFASMYLPMPVEVIYHAAQ